MDWPPSQALCEMGKKINLHFFCKRTNPTHFCEPKRTGLHRVPTTKSNFYI